MSALVAHSGTSFKQQLQCSLAATIFHLSSFRGWLVATEISWIFDFFYNPPADINSLIIFDWSYITSQLEDYPYWFPECYHDTPRRQRKLLARSSNIWQVTPNWFTLGNLSETNMELMSAGGLYKKSKMQAISVAACLPPPVDRRRR